MIEPPESIVICIAVADSLADAIAAVLPDTLDSPPLILPSSQSRQDVSVAAVRRLLRSRGIASSLLTPAGVLARSPFTRPEGGDWRPVSIELPGQPIFSVSLPHRLVTSPDIWIVTDLDAVAGRGPHVLDLPVRYIRRFDRLRALTSGDRTWMVALADRLPITRVVSTMTSGDLSIATSTSDMTAGELLALSLAGLRLPPTASVAGVWEDPLVQRATDLEIGALHPGQIRPVVQLRTDNPASAPLVNRILMAMSVDIDDRHRKTS